jgi:hypothetical protein
MGEDVVSIGSSTGELSRFAGIASGTNRHQFSGALQLRGAVASPFRLPLILLRLELGLLRLVPVTLRHRYLQLTNGACKFCGQVWRPEEGRLAIHGLGGVSAPSTGGGAPAGRPLPRAAS